MTVSVKDKIVIITGAGRGLGRAYALALADAGARVVVNDLGAGVDGNGQDATVASQVVDEISARGGQAVASEHDITDPSQAQAIVALARKTFGGLHGLINNAGIIGHNAFVDYTIDDFRRCWQVHVEGSINMMQAAWPIMAGQGYGRIVLTESGAGLYGMEGQAIYSTAKGAIHGLMKTTALEGKPQGILINAISPGGYSRMHEPSIKDPKVLEQMQKIMPADLVAPAAVWLVSDDCQAHGEVFAVWCGRIARVAIGSGSGYSDTSLSAQGISDNYASIADTTALYEPTSSLDEVTAWFEGKIQH